jgi:regulator of sigma D
VLSSARDLYPRIARTTQCAADFSEQYRGRDWDNIPATLHQDLSRLCEELTVRIELEDQLINELFLRDDQIA